MAKTDISENIYRAIDTIVDARLQNINFNSTVLCTVIDDSKAASGIFTVDNTGVKFQATSLDKSLKNNDQVYVTIPNNDFGAQKIILCKKEDFEDEVEGWRNPLNYLDIKYQLDEDSDIVELIPTNSHADIVPVLINEIILEDYYKEEFTSEDDFVEAHFFGNIAEAEYYLLHSGWKPLAPSTKDYLNKKNNIRIVLFRPWGYKKNHPGVFSEDGFVRIKQFGKYPVPTDESYYCEYDNENEKWTIYNPTSGNYCKWKDMGYFDTVNDERHEVDDWQQEYLVNIPIQNYSVNLFYNDKYYQPIGLKGLKNIVFTIDCKTNLKEDNITEGTYGTYCEITLQNDYETKVIQLNMQNDQDFLGDTYNFFDFYTQTALFDVTNYQDYTVLQVKFYAYQKNDFSHTPQDSKYKIYFRNPKLYFGLSKQESFKGYKTVDSYFATIGKQYQKLDLFGVINIYNSLQKIPPIDLELIDDGPFVYQIGDYYQLTNDTEPKSGKTYYYNINGQPVPSSSTDNSNPKNKGWYEYIAESQGKRYVPKLYFKDVNGNFIVSAYENIKYYDDLFNQSGWITTHDWSENKYYWNSKEQIWKLRNLNESNFPDTLEPYICYLPGRIVSGTFGTLSSNNETSRPSLGISTNDNNVDLVLATENDRSNIRINNLKSKLELTDNALQLNFQDTALINFEKTNLNLNFQDKSIINLADSELQLKFGSNKSLIKLTNTELQLNFNINSSVSCKNKEILLKQQSNDIYSQISVKDTQLILDNFFDNTNNSRYLNGVKLHWSADTTESHFASLRAGSEAGSTNPVIVFALKNGNNNTVDVVLGMTNMTRFYKLLNNYDLIKRTCGNTWNDSLQN